MPNAALTMRRWDDGARVPEAPTVTLDFIERIMATVLAATDQGS